MFGVSWAVLDQVWGLTPELIGGQRTPANYLHEIVVFAGEFVGSIRFGV